MTSELKQQFTLKISQANKTRLVVILYEMMLVYIEEARQANEAGDQESFRKGIKNAKGCLHELMASLHLEYPVAENLMQLYCMLPMKLSVSRMNHHPLWQTRRPSTRDLLMAETT